MPLVCPRPCSYKTSVLLPDRFLQTKGGSSRLQTNTCCPQALLFYFLFASKAWFRQQSLQIILSILSSVEKEAKDPLSQGLAPQCHLPEMLSCVPLLKSPQSSPSGLEQSQGVTVAFEARRDLCFILITRCSDTLASCCSVNPTISDGSATADPWPGVFPTHPGVAHRHTSFTCPPSVILMSLSLISYINTHVLSHPQDSLFLHSVYFH